MLRIKFVLVGLFVAVVVSGCATSSQVTFPSSREIFMTTGDGDIQKPYEPLGQLLYYETGFRLGFLPLFGLIPIADVDPDVAIKKGISDKVRAMGGNGVINLYIDWEPPKNRFLLLGLFATGGRIKIYGTVIKR